MEQQDIEFRPFDKQAEFLQASDRIILAASGKRGGKTESGAIRSIVYTEQKIGFRDNGRDPYRGAIIAPTTSMLRRLSLKKFLAFAKPFNFTHNKTEDQIFWENGAEIQGISADKPARAEGDKFNWIWMDEVFQMSEQMFDEAIARVADTQGSIWLTGSLGTQYANPKNHWVYKRLKLNPMDGSRVFEWTTADNPYFPRAELERLRDTLDPLSYRQMFTISWDTVATAAVYGDFSDANLIKGYVYNPNLETSVSVDWGWTNPTAILFFQYDERNDTVYLFDEIIRSRMTIEQAYEAIMAKNYRIKNWYCDIAGTQEREQTGRSNVEWFRQPPRNIHFQYRSTKITYGLPIVRSYILNGKGQRKLYVDEVKCAKSIDSIRNYSYPKKDGMITDENPIKEADHEVDSLRYYMVNRHDFMRPQETTKTFSRWGAISR